MTFRWNLKECQQSVMQRWHEDSGKRECEEQKQQHSWTWEDIYILHEMRDVPIVYCRLAVQRKTSYTGSPSLKDFSYSAKKSHTPKKLAYKPLTLEGEWRKHTDSFLYNRGFIDVRRKKKWGIHLQRYKKIKWRQKRNDDWGRDVNGEKEGTSKWHTTTVLKIKMFDLMRFQLPSCGLIPESFALHWGQGKTTQCSRFTFLCSA